VMDAPRRRRRSLSRCPQVTGPQLGPLLTSVDVGAVSRHARSMVVAARGRKDGNGRRAVYRRSMTTSRAGALPDPDLAASAVVVGTARLGTGSLLAQGAVVRSSHDGALTVGAGSAVLENCVVIGDAAAPTVIGRRTVFGHRCLV